MVHPQVLFCLLLSATSLLSTVSAQSGTCGGDESAAKPVVVSFWRVTTLFLSLSIASPSLDVGWRMVSD